MKLFPFLFAFFFTFP
ncbi:hypothetical protein [Enterobacter sp. Ap-1006]|nr:hypothetical protein [Enterobacter sp. Ap-1006]